MENLQKTLRSIVKDPRHFFKLSIQGLLVGIFSGIMVCLYRFLLGASEGILREFLPLITSNIFYIILWFSFLVILALILSYLVKWEPDSAGSGIPHIYAEVKGHMEVNWKKSLFSKIVEGVVTVLGGLSLGPEGPSVQIGGMAGKGISKLFNGSKTDEIRLILVGSAVGITAAFNAPLAGVIFILEEINHGFDKTLIFIALIAAIVSDFISKVIFGQSTLLSFPVLNVPLEYYWLLLILGVFIGLLGYLYNIGMVKSSDLWNKIPDFPLELKFILVFLVSGVIALYIPEVLDGGHFMMDILGVAVPSLGVLLVLFIAKYFFSLFSFSSGAPGGIFLPILVIGAYIGAIFGAIAIPVLGLENDLIYKFIIISMAGFFTATVRSPITGIVLLSEMSGSTESLVAMIIVCLIAYVIPTLLKNEPIYETLFERLLIKENQEFVRQPSKHVLSEYFVPLDCDFIDKEIHEIPFPKNAIVVSIIRDGSYIIAQDGLKIKYGDQIHFLTDVNDYPYVHEEIEFLISND